MANRITIESMDGSKCIGKLENGKYHELGKLVLADCTQYYDGQWLTGSIRALGNKNFRAENSMVEDFKDDVQHEEGWLHFPNGQFYQGAFRMAPFMVMVF